MTKHNIEEGLASQSNAENLQPPTPYVMFCYLPDSGRHVTRVFQGLSISRSRGGEGEDPGNEVDDAALKFL